MKHFVLGSILSLISWDVIEFALQTHKRPIETEAVICLLVLGFIYLLIPIYKNGKKPIYIAIIISFLHLAFAIAGTIISPPDQGFGKIGPGVAVVILLVILISCFKSIGDMKTQTN